MPTIEEFYNELCHVYKGHAFNLEFVDTSGPFEFPAMRDMNILHADVAMVIYDVTNEESMKVVAAILSIISQVRGPGNPLHCIIVGNKYDLYMGEDNGDIYRILDEYIGFYPDWISYHRLTSAKTDEDVTGVLELALDHILLTTPEDCLRAWPYEVHHIFNVLCSTISCCGKCFCTNRYKE